MLDDDYPYTSGKTKTEGRCAHDNKKVIDKVTRWVDLTSVKSMIRRVKKQPLSVVINANSPALRMYKSGVITKKACPGGCLNHSVAVVGLTLNKEDEQGNTNYWMVQNSWGSWWGDKGFARFNIEENGTGVCDMYRHPKFVDGFYNGRN